MIYSASMIADDRQFIVDRMINEVGKNNFGTEFWFSVPPPLTDNLQNKYNTIRIYAIPLSDGKITLNIQSKNYTKENFVKAGEISEFILTPDLAQPYIKTGENQAIESDIYRSAAIKIIGDIAFSCYAVAIYNNSVESFLAYPINLLGKEYTISTYNDPVQYYPILNSLPAIVTITSPFDDNEIEFIMGGNSVSKTSDGLIPGNSLKRFLQKGDVWTISSDGKNADLSGSKVTGKYPISVVSANQYANIPLGVKSGNYAVEMETPSKSWSNTYFVGNLFNRKFSKIVRIYAKEENTEIKVNNYPVGTINKTNGIVNEAYLDVRLSDIDDNKFYAIEGNKDIYVVSYSTGTEEDGLPIPQGGVFKQVVSPYSQFTKTVFFSLPSNSLSDFNGHYLNIITETDEFGNISDSLLLFQFKVSNTIKNKVKDLKPLLRRDLAGINGKNFAFLTLEIKTDGAYSLISDKPFFAELFGHKNTFAYGFPAGFNLEDNNSTDEIAPIVSWANKCDGIIEGITEDISDKTSLPSNIAGHLFISNESENIKLIEIDKIIPGTQKIINWKLKVNDISKYAKAKIKFWDAASNITDAIIEFYPSQLKFENNIENFGSFKLNEDREKAIYLLNESDKDIFIDQLSLKYGDKGFEILNPNNISIAAKSQFAVNIKFTAISDGIVFDSLGVQDSCGIIYKVRLEANIGSPIINVSDINFGDNIIGSSITHYSTIKNNGVSDLIINGYRLPESIQFVVDFGREIDPSNPLIIEPKKSFEYGVTFLPSEERQYFDSIVFISDAKIQDNVCLINARGVQPGLICTSINWGNKRIHRTEIPAGPYQPNNEDNGFAIYNKGTKDLKITKVERIEQINPESFEINFLQINNQEIKKGEKIVLPVAFRPTIAGTSKIVVELTDEFNNKTQAELVGLGVVPQLESKTMDCDTVLTQIYSNPKIINFEIHNKSYSEWEFADTVVIFDIKSDDGHISEDWEYYGSMGFKFDKSKINFPLKLVPGETYNIPIAFAPDSAGQKLAKLTVVSDELNKSEFVIKGYGIDQNFSVSDAYGETCINSEVVIISTIKNNGNTDLNILPLNFSEYHSEISFVDNEEIKDGFLLAAQQHKDIKISFKPSSKIEKTTNLLVQTKENPDLIRSGKITGKSMAYRINSFISPLEQTTQIGEQVSINVNLEATEFNENTNINELLLHIEYNYKALKPDLNKIIDSKFIEGKFYKEAKIEKAGLLSIKLSGLNGSVINQSTDLFEIFFDTFYPNDSINYSDIYINPVDVDNKCVDIRKSMGRINIKAECQSQLRQFNLSDSKYSLTAKNTHENIEVNFGIGISAITLMKIYNINGEQIFKEDYGKLNTGNYQAIFSKDNLSSGIYFVEINSGPFYKTEKIILYK